MQLTYRILVEALNEVFLEDVKSRFAGKEVSITVQETEEMADPGPMERFNKMEKLRKKLEKVKVNPKLDLAALANEVNL